MVVKSSCCEIMVGDPCFSPRFILFKLVWLGIFFVIFVTKSQWGCEISEFVVSLSLPMDIQTYHGWEVLWLDHLRMKSLKLSPNIIMDMFGQKYYNMSRMIHITLNRVFPSFLLWAWVRWYVNDSPPWNWEFAPENGWLEFGIRSFPFGVSAYFQGL